MNIHVSINTFAHAGFRGCPEESFKNVPSLSSNFFRSTAVFLMIFLTGIVCFLFGSCPIPSNAKSGWYCQVLFFKQVPPVNAPFKRWSIKSLYSPLSKYSGDDMNEKNLLRSDDAAIKPQRRYHICRKSHVSIPWWDVDHKTVETKIRGMQSNLAIEPRFQRWQKTNT